MTKEELENTRKEYHNIEKIIEILFFKSKYVTDDQFCNILESFVKKFKEIKKTLNS